MIEFTPTSKIGRIDIHGTECFTDAYITEIQRRLALLKYAKSFVEKTLMERNIASRDLMPSTRTVAAVLSPTVDPCLKVIPLPVHMQFVDLADEFSADVLVDGDPGRNPKITVTLYKKEEGDTYIYIPDTDSWTMLEPDKQHPLIKLMETSSGVQFSEKEAEGILDINQKLIQLHDEPHLRGLLKYGLFFITREKDGAIIRDGRACLISRNPSCVGMGIVLDKSEAKRS